MTVLYLIAVAAIIFGWWRLSLLFWPWAPCRRCRGRRGRNRGSTGRAWGECRHCGGSGRRLRRGARER